MEREEYARIARVQERHWWYRSTRALLSAVLGPSLREGGHFLDAGGGTGATGAWLSRYGNLTAVDIEPEALGYYRRVAPTASTVQADVQALPFGKGAFDGALAVTVLYHEAVADPSRAVSEMVRVVRPGGWVCLMEPSQPSLRRAHDRQTATARRWRGGQLADLLRSAGALPVRVTGAYLFLVPAAWISSVIYRCSSSDLEAWQPARLLTALASIERAILTTRGLPDGLSTIVLARV